MAESELNPQLQLAEPMATPVLNGAAVAAIVAVAGGFLVAGLFVTSPQTPDIASAVPKTFADLGPGMVTPVDPHHRAGVAAAVAALRLPESQRNEIEKAVLAEQSRIGWIVLVDSMDPDGDTVSVHAGGVTQTIVLSKAWTPVAVPLGEAPSIGITAVRDGGGGGVTVAVATLQGPLVLRNMLPGEHIEVMP
jgi:hypothetical protein